MSKRLMMSVWALTAMVMTSTGAFAVAAAEEQEQPKTAEIGKPAPTFTLTDTAGNTVDLAKLIAEEKIIVLEWFNHECPFVVKHYQRSTTMNDLAAKYQEKGIVWLAISSSYNVDAETNAEWAKKWKMNHPLLVDQPGKVARMYDAKTTPHMYIIHKDGTLVYTGAIDTSRNAAAPDTEAEDYINYVDKALKEILAGEKVSTPQTRPYGCSMKYAPTAVAPVEATEALACGCSGGKKGDDDTTTKGSDEVASAGCGGGSCGGGTKGDKDTKGDEVACGSKKKGSCGTKGGSDSGSEEVA